MSAKKTLLEVTHETFLGHWAHQKDGRRSLERAKACLAVLGEATFVDEITGATLADLAIFFAAKGLGPATVNRNLSAIRKVLSVAERRGYITRAPSVEHRREPRGRTLVITPDEFDRVAGHVGRSVGGRYERFLRFLWDTGMRLSEALSVRGSDLEMTPGGDMLIHVRDTKNGDDRVVPATARVRADLYFTVGLDSPIFGGGHDIRVYRSTLQHAWKRAVDVLIAYERRPEFVIHAIRHTCASRLLNNGVPITTIQKWLGHRDIKTTSRYAHLATGALVEAAKTLETLQGTNP